MTLPTGQISLSQVNTELGYSSTAQISLNDAAVRSLAGVPSGAISMANLQGKSNQFAFTISTNQTNADLRTLAVTAGWNQSSKVVATIGTGVYISSNATGTPGLTISGSFPNGVDLVNNGFIIGMGGAGGNGGGCINVSPQAGAAGSAGGLALSVSTAVNITNNNTIGGGGGGGGGGKGGYAIWYDGKLTYYTPLSAGGGGGGRSGAAANSAGGAYGTNNYANGTAGSAGTSAAAGNGGAGATGSGGVGGNGGAGGTWGAAGSTGTSGSGIASGVGPYAGGAAGAAVTGNANITWTAIGTRYGAIS